MSTTHIITLCAGLSALALGCLIEGLRDLRARRRLKQRLDSIRCEMTGASK